MQVQPIQVERDIEGVRLACLALFEESFQRQAIAQAMRTADRETRERAIESIDGRQMSPGYYGWAAHLLDISTSMELGITFTSHDLTRAEVLGLQAVRSARAEFDHEHPFCPACGVRQDSRLAPSCKACSYSRSKR
ncbi:hypothetical protein ACFQBQ_07570 [Granulicella cerasi]|uniref:Uncharacterized protein n=1 Tax=Granulicella cerasi TaxID=741063 RepID=A0ABW1Z785_9BACT|nr:hypothetical protein [Granulicella cerasi]